MLFIGGFNGLNYCYQNFKKRFWKDIFNELSFKNDVQKQIKDLEKIIQEGDLEKQKSQISQTQN